MFDVKSKTDNSIVRQVFAVREAQGIEFLIYHMGEWMWMPARYYEPDIEVLEGRKE